MNFGKTLSEATTGIHEHLDNPITDISVDGKVKSLITKVIDVLFPVMVVIGVLMAMLGFYKILTSSDENKIKEGMTIILSGVIGIIIMYSAKYLSHALFAHVFNQTSGNSREVREMLEALYNQVWFPFVKIAVYLSLGILVILMMIRVFSYITSQDEDSKKKSLGVIAWTTIGILFITAAKQIVEAVYGKQSTMLTSNSVDNLSKIGTHVLNPKEIPILFSIINWSLGIISFVLLVMILMQTYKMLTKPDDAETYTSLKKTIIYAL